MGAYRIQENALSNLKIKYISVTKSVNCLSFFFNYRNKSVIIVKWWNPGISISLTCHYYGKLILSIKYMLEIILTSSTCVEDYTNLVIVNLAQGLVLVKQRMILSTLP